MPQHDEKANHPGSFRGRLWDVGEIVQSMAAEMREAGANALTAKILSARGMRPDDYERYASPRIRDWMPDPNTLKDMQPGVKRAARAIREGQRIGIWSDYDVDGACLAALFIEILRGCGHEDFVLRIPDRITEGYGPNTPGLLSMQRDQGCELIFCLDAGIVAFEPMAAAKAAGIEMVVIDHHNAAQDGTLPEGVAIINPNRLDDTSGLGHLCAAGVTFCFFVGVVRELIREGHFDGKDGRPAERPDLMEYLDLVALATVCDVMKLHGLNRAFVHKGTEFLTKRRNPGVAALALAAGIDPSEPISEKTCGWVLGPRINAGGRVGASDSGALLLIERDQAEAARRAAALHAINVERKELSDSVTEQALDQLRDFRAGIDHRLAMAIVEDAHEGVVGIAAGKVKEGKDAPAIVVTRDHNGNLKGSARSVGDVNIGHIIQDAAAAGLILGGGGHGAAGGLSLRHDQVAAFIDFADAEIRKTAYAEEGIRSACDLKVQLKELSLEAIRSVDAMAPFGNGNEKPRLLLGPVILSEIRVIKEKHMKLSMRAPGGMIDGLIWGVVGTPVGDSIEAAIGKPIEVLGTAEINTFNGKSNPQFMIDDIRYPGGPEAELAAGPLDAADAGGLAQAAAEVLTLDEIDEAVVARNEGRMVLVTGLVLESFQPVKDKHLRVVFGADGKQLTAMKWNSASGEFADRVQVSAGTLVNAYGQLELNEYRGRTSIQMKLKDFEADQPELSLGGVAAP